MNMIPFNCQVWWALVDPSAFPV